ncbi:glutamate--cysteine ligase [Billgrantia tianxiuensis]|uniref:Glutamate--cysteine ligase n=1 Tax=Billgrantia tianxiuensis TaxID=2497861 RepID=A0A6I6STB8_9GAMM|nr:MULTISPECIES: glutamate--cysteine ligase [Halomonas]MCE8034231.1 glutamate--cysteine ligase [Halomonas sp. MCCC 1A11057]QHC50955.1 glutamate--cysteine ligase [Halomonas tianxiuensis]
MSDSYSATVSHLAGLAARGRFGRLRRGLEKEGLRVDRAGRIASTPHPHALGSKLTHPHITTDYSEALLEYITPVYCRPGDALDFLADLHRFSYRHLGEELIWPASMPARLDGNDSVIIADYGSSNVGTMKHVYRKGLDVRYGRIMQAIAGIHYNVSLPDELWGVLRERDGATQMSLDDYRSSRYFGLIRNFRRHSWLLLYLFGASPALDRSFLPEGNIPDKLHAHGRDTLVSPYATSLRMSDLGYQNKVQAQLKICFNSLSNYVGTLRHAISTPWPAYEALGVTDGRDWQQLNANILQIENEYYSDIRPKRVTRHSETPSQALEARGVEYIEVRCLDLDPFLPLGIDEPRLRFIDAFMMWCLLSESPWIPDEECDRLDDNRRLVVERGRDPELRLVQDGRQRSVADWGGEILGEIAQVADLLDSLEEGAPHADAVAAFQPWLEDPSLTPSGRLLARLEETGEEFLEAILAIAGEHAERFRQEAIDSARAATFEQMVETSHQQQRDIETADTQRFDEFLDHYFASASEPRVAMASQGAVR